MAKILFHIGCPKTGSSAIQNALNLTSSILLASGVHVPDEKFLIQPSMLNSGNGEWLANFCTGIWPAKSAKGQASLNAFSKLLKRQENTILSSESFYYSTEAALNIINKGLLEKYDEIGLVLYLRHPADMCHSLWMQGVKRTDSEPVSLVDFANDFIFDPEQVIKRFENSFNKITKFIISYESVGNDVVPSFFMAIQKFFELDFNYAGEYYNIFSNSSAESCGINRSINGAELHFFQTLTAILHGKKVPAVSIHEAKRQCSDIILSKSIPGDAVVCPKEIVDIVTMKSQSAIKYLFDNYGLSFRSRSGSARIEKVTEDRNELSLAMAEIVGHFAARIPPSLPVVHLRPGDNFEFDGFIDHSSSVFISGWMVCKTYPMSSVLVLISVGLFEFTLLANNFREDVAAQHPSYSPYCGYYYEFNSDVAELISKGESINVSVLRA